MSRPGIEVEMVLMGDVWVISDQHLPTGAVPWTDTQMHDLLRLTREYEIRVYESTGLSGNQGGIQALRGKGYQIEESAPEALVYTRSDPSLEEVRNVIRTYCAGILPSSPTHEVKLLSEGK